MAANTLKRPYVRPHWTIQQRLDHRTDKSGGVDACWPWKGATKSGGYGRLAWMGRSHLAHRLSWIATHGPIPVGKHVCHHCDNPPCINPAHLFCDTQAGNLADMRAKGRPAGGRPNWGARNGNAKLAEEQVRTIRSLKGTITQREIAARFGVHLSTVEYILSGGTWKHVA